MILGHRSGFRTGSQLLPVRPVVDITLLEKLHRAGEELEMIPVIPTLERLDCSQDREAPVAIAVDERPAREELGQVVRVVRFLVQALRQVQADIVVVAARAVEGNLIRGDHPAFGIGVVDAIGENGVGARVGARDVGRGVDISAELQDKAVHG